MRCTIPTRDEVALEAEAAISELVSYCDFVPGFHRALTLSPAVLEGFRVLSAATSGVLDRKLRVRIAIAVSQANTCDYCVRSHSHIAVNQAHLSPEEVELTRKGCGVDAKSQAALNLALRITCTRGHIGDEAMNEARVAGFADNEIIGIAALTAQCLFANMINSVLQTDADFPSLGAPDAPEIDETQ